MKASWKYLIMSLLAMALLGFAEYHGWAPSSVLPAAEPLPQSVRDNPGAYRAHYVRTGRYVGGK
ncbi:MAG: hypothetical protein HKN72_16620 [Gemmatimonadetes bacterium]|nr:hypothetical protein [Gemmatimonadota bacterium]NNL29497.1 hypothetical protein [Gemmatimonadota bacterium]